MKYQVGDKIKIKVNLKGGKQYGNIYFSFDMKKYCGKEYIVSSIEKNRGIDCYKIPEAEWFFSEEMVQRSNPALKRK